MIVMRKDVSVLRFMEQYYLTPEIKLNSQKRIKVSGVGGVPSYITSSAQIKITLGWRVVYVMDVWVTNIGEGVDVLLGMDFMFSAGVRLGIREGMVGLPDEESILMYGYTIRRREYWDIPVCLLRGLHLRPGEHANVAIRYGQCRPLQDVVWAGRGDLWVTQIVYGAPSWAVAIKVVNVSDRDCWIERRTLVARIAEYGNIPIVGQFVRPGLRRCMEWQQVIQENTLSAKTRVRQEAYEQMLRYAAPPLLVRPKEPERAQVTKIAEESQPQRNVDVAESVEDATPGTYSPSAIGSLMAVEVPPEHVTLDVNTPDGGEVANSGSCGEGLGEMAQGFECDAFQDDASVDDEVSRYLLLPCLEHHSQDSMQHIPVSAEELDLEPVVYIREGSELMAQLKISWLCYLTWMISLLNVILRPLTFGEPGESTEAEDKQLKAVLKRHQNIF
ncbi:hypothetical protein PHMEG_00014601 [Phytophthora megakarya]|uniref:Aspartic protease n=1 Tax=Phytophthora megakarya TaxID=4795 RepID=A0A225W4Z0_9STRA|nr:hypothetical protein PHMEG_00014601 [Phytophthora megakarya]